MTRCLSSSAALIVVAVAGAPPPAEKATTARWMVQTLDWGVLSTISTRSKGTEVGDAFGNPYSFADASNGVPYFYASDLDASMVDVFPSSLAHPTASLALSEASLTGNASIAACEIGTPLGDPENPPCARLVLTGEIVRLAANTTEEVEAKVALFQRHPSFANYPPGHDFFVAKMDVANIWLIDFYGGAANILPEDYFAANAPDNELPRPMKESVAPALPRPPAQKKVATARWMANVVDWGVLSTISTRSNGTEVGDAFGNPYSFSDAANGVPYFYASELDASMIDIFSPATANVRASLALSEASLSGTNNSVAACTIGTPLGDPENPPCARLVVSGRIVRLKVNTTEELKAKEALFQKHPSFADYPPGHDFFVAKMEVSDIWLIDFYGGAAYISPADYFAYNKSSSLSPVVI